MGAGDANTPVVAQMTASLPPTAIGVAIIAGSEIHELKNRFRSRIKTS